MSAVKVGFTEVEFESRAVLPDGFDTNDHEYVNGSPLASLLPDASSDTIAPVRTFCNKPEFAIGAIFSVEAVTVTEVGALVSKPSLVISRIT